MKPLVKFTETIYWKGSYLVLGIAKPMPILQQIKKFFTFEPFLSRSEMDASSSFILIREDDVRQVELLPFENQEYLEVEVAKIRKFADEHFDGNGWTAIYERDEPPVMLKRRAISPFALMSTMKKKEFMLREVRYQSAPSTPTFDLAFVKEGFRFYINLKNGAVNSIYFDRNIMDQEVARETIQYLSRMHDLILVDWRRLEVVDARDVNELHRYLLS